MLGGTFTANQADSRGEVEAKFNVVDADSSQLKAIEMAIFRQHNVEFALQFIGKSGIDYHIVDVYADTVRVDVGLSCKTYRCKQYGREIVQSYKF